MQNPTLNPSSSLLQPLLLRVNLMPHLVIIDIEPRHIHVGIAGESYPTTVSYKPPHSLGPSNCPHQGPLFLGLDHAMTRHQREEVVTNLRPDYKQMMARYENEYHRWLNISDTAAVEAVLASVFSTHLVLSPHKCKVAVIDRNYCHSHKVTIVETLISTLGVALVLWLPHAVMTVVGAGLEDAVVVEMGWQSCRVDVISDLRNVTPVNVNFSPLCLARHWTREWHHYHHENGEFDEIELAIDTIPTEWDFSDAYAIVDKVVATLPVDTRAAVSTVIVSGDLTTAGGFDQRWATTVPGKPRATVGAWGGASVYLSSINLPQLWRHQITRDNIRMWKVDGVEPLLAR